MKIVVLFMVMATVLAILTGCGGPPEGGEEDDKGGGFTEYVVPLNDGRTVVCLYKSAGYGGGLSCDWSNAR